MDVSNISEFVTRLIFDTRHSPSQLPLHLAWHGGLARYQPTIKAIEEQHSCSCNDLLRVTGESRHSLPPRRYIATSGVWGFKDLWCDTLLAVHFAGVIIINPGHVAPTITFVATTAEWPSPFLGIRCVQLAIHDWLCHPILSVLCHYRLPLCSIPLFVH